MVGVKREGERAEGRGKWIGEGEEGEEKGGIEKRPLRYQTPQSVLGAGNCGDQSLPLTMYYVGEKLGENRGRNGRILTPSERVFTFGVPVYGVKFYQN